MRKAALILCSLLSACLGDKNGNTAEEIKTYVISLDRTPERFAFVKKQLDEQNLKYKKFKAVDGYELDFQNAETGEFLASEKKKDFSKYSWENGPTTYNVVLHGRTLMKIFVEKKQFSLGEIGVTCSHREIWKEMIKNNYDKVMVFEDDVIFDKDFKKNLAEYVADLPDDWDIAFLGVGLGRSYKYGYSVCVGEVFRDIDNVENHPHVAKIQPTNLVYGMYGYIINQKGAKKLLELTDFSKYPIDNIVFLNAGKLNEYVAMKKMLEPKLYKSEIKKMGRTH